MRGEFSLSHGGLNRARNWKRWIRPKNAYSSTRLLYSESVPVGPAQVTVCNFLQKMHHLFFIRLRSLTKSRGMLRPIYSPQFFGTARSSIDLLGVAAGNRGVSCAANQEHRNGTRGHGFLWRDLVGVKSASLCECLHGENRSRTKKGFAKKWTEAQSCIVVAYFAQVDKWVFRYDAFNAWFDDCLLQCDGRSHRNTECVEMTSFFRRIQCVHNADCVVAFFPAILPPLSPWARFARNVRDQVA